MRLTYRPIAGDWQGKHSTEWDRKSPSYFKADWASTVSLLERELEAIGVARDAYVALQLDIQEADMRLDGAIRGDARPATQAVILSFEAKIAGKPVPLRYQCDRFATWKHNVRAIALGLEALRKVENYGIASRGEQYQGWAALPPSSGSEENVKRRFGSPAEAASHVAQAAGIFDAGSIMPILLSDKEYFDDVFKRAVRRSGVHPDNPVSGDRSAWDTLVEARKVVENARQAQAAAR